MAIATTLCYFSGSTPCSQSSITSINDLEWPYRWLDDCQFDVSSHWFTHLLAIIATALSANGSAIANAALGCHRYIPARPTATQTLPQSRQRTSRPASVSGHDTGSPSSSCCTPSRKRSRVNTDNGPRSYCNILPIRHTANPRISNSASCNGLSPWPSYLRLHYWHRLGYWCRLAHRLSHNTILRLPDW